MFISWTSFIFHGKNVISSAAQIIVLKNSRADRQLVHEQKEGIPLFLGGMPSVFQKYRIKLQ